MLYHMCLEVYLLAFKGRQDPPALARPSQRGRSLEQAPDIAVRGVPARPWLVGPCLPRPKLGDCWRHQLASAPAPPATAAFFDAVRLEEKRGPLRLGARRFADAS